MYMPWGPRGLAMDRSRLSHVLYIGHPLLDFPTGSDVGLILCLGKGLLG
jgi:hypothetical protein